MLHRLLTAQLQITSDMGRTVTAKSSGADVVYEGVWLHEVLKSEDGPIRGSSTVNSPHFNNSLYGFTSAWGSLAGCGRLAIGQLPVCGLAAATRAGWQPAGNQLSGRLIRRRMVPQVTTAIVKMR